MTPLVTADQLAERLQNPNADAASSAQAIENASGLVRAIGRQTYSFVSQEAIVLKGGERILDLPQRPLVVDFANPLTVRELGDFGNLDQTLVENQGYTRLGNQLTRGYPWFHTSRLQGWPRQSPLGVWAHRVQVTYSHGYAIVPDDIVAVVLDIAQSLYTNPSGLRSWTVPEYSETYATELLGAATVDSIRQRLVATGRKRTSHSI